MEKQQFRCKHCKKLKVQRVLDQKYCSEKACQQARKNAWRRDKYAEDTDYRRNQQASTAAWLSRQGGAAAYYRRYRSRRKASIVALENGSGEAEGGPTSEAARALRVRGKKHLEYRPSFANANRDACLGDFCLKSGNYMLRPADANRDVYLVEIRVIPDG